MTQDFLSQILGKQLATLSDLRAALLPPKLGMEVALAIAESANASRNSPKIPYAVVISKANEIAKSNQISQDNTIKYRLGDRLFIAPERTSALASLDRVVVAALDENFPQSAKDVVSIPALSLEIVKFVGQETGVEISHSDLEASSEFVMDCLETLMEAHREIAINASVDWNVLWYRHVNIGIANLISVLPTLQASNPNLTVETFFRGFTFASFGLAKPEQGSKFKGKTRGIGRDIDQAINSWWSDEATIAGTVEILNKRAQAESPESKHPISDLNWSDFDQLNRSEDSHLLAFANLAKQSPEKIICFAGFTETEFFNPVPPSESGQTLTIFDANTDASLRLPFCPDDDVFLIQPNRAAEASNGVFESKEVRILIPVLFNLTEDLIEKSSITINCGKGRDLAWKGSLEIANGSLFAVGHFEFKPFNTYAKTATKKHKITLKVPENDAAAGFLDEKASAEVIILPGSSNGVLVSELKAGNKSSTFSYVGPADAKDSDESFTHAVSDGKKNHIVIAWGSQMILEGQSVDALEAFDYLFATETKVPSSIEILLDEIEITLRANVEVRSLESPIVAAIQRDKLSADAPSPENRDSIRGQLEASFVRSLVNDSWRQNNGHIVLPTDAIVSFGSLSAGLRSEFLIDPATNSAFQAATQFEASKTFLASPAVSAFREAFDGLHILESLQSRSGSKDHPDWPSRTSWRHLWKDGHQRIDAYISAYSEMIKAAKATGDASNVFWATYPFSASIWDLSVTGKCQGVLLSPLHPIRLGWLASVEDTLWDSEMAALLAGTIEGWNLPLLAPSPNKNGTFLAVPADAGEGQLFLGWSYLVSASIAGAESLETPLKIAGLPAPGSASGGMNASATLSALKDYRRVNPHVTTLTIDLAAAQRSSRLREMDDAILDATRKWSSADTTSLPGGIRVWDSLNREGDAPIEDTQVLISQGISTPMTWTRYQHNNASTKKCNVRLLQDTGLRIEVEPTGNRELGAANLGVLGSIPLRRFEAFSGKSDDNKLALSFPTLNQGSSNSAFYEALMVVERASDRPSIRTQLFKALLVDENADWTVSGESMISPSGITSLLETGSTQRMLWEWRPPFFDQDAEAALEQRPFLSIARIPQSFREQIRMLLTKATGSDAEEKAVDEILSRLGSRGVGLSSLIAMGGTHAAGALGFFLALSLIDQLEASSSDSFVMPIDACDSFLRALTGDTVPANLTKRADLLVFTLSDQKLTLTPIEIKFYGLGRDKPTAKLPNPGDNLLAEAKNQALETSRLLSLLRQRQEKLKEETSAADYAVWLNALGALVEAGIKLRPTESEDPDRLRNRLQHLVSGGLDIEVGKPLITYFSHNSKTDNGGNFSVTKNFDGATEWGLLSANTAAVFEAVNGKENSPLVNDWRDLLAWAITDPQLAPETDIEFNSPSTPSDSTGANNEVPGEGQPPSPKDADESAPEGVPDEEDLVTPTPNPREEEPSEPTNGNPVADETTAGSSSNKTESPTEELVYPDEVSRWDKNDGVRAVIGDLTGTIAPSQSDFWPGNTALTQMNFGVVGNLGTGKTQFLLSLICQLRLSAKRTQDNPLNFLIFDYKRDYQKDEFLSRVGGHRLSPDEGIPLNVLALRGEYSKNKAVKKAQAFTDVLAKIYSNVGPVQKETLVEAIYELFEKNEFHRAPSLSEVLAEYKSKNGGKSDSVTSIINKFVLRGTFIEDPGSLKTFDELIDDKVLVVSLFEFGPDNDTKNTLVVLMLDLYYEYMTASTKWPFKGSDPQIRKLNSFLLVDEATNIMNYEFPILKSILLEGREYGFGTILASQYLSHFKTSGNNYSEALNSWMIHQVPFVTGAQLSALGLPNTSDATAAKITQLPAHEAFYSSMNFKGVFVKGLPYFRLFPDSGT